MPSTVNGTVTDGTVTWTLRAKVQSVNNIVADENGNIAIPCVDLTSTQDITGRKNMKNLYLLNFSEIEGGELRLISGKNTNNSVGIDLYENDNHLVRIIDYRVTGEETQIPFQFFLDSGIITTKEGTVEQIAANGTGSSFKYIKYTSGLQTCWTMGTTIDTNQTITLPVSFSSAVAIAIDAGLPDGTVSNLANVGARWLNTNKVRLYIESGIGYALIVIGIA